MMEEGRVGAPTLPDEVSELLYRAIACLHLPIDYIAVKMGRHPGVLPRRRLVCQ